MHKRSLAIVQMEIVGGLYTSHHYEAPVSTLLDATVLVAILCRLRARQQGYRQLPSLRHT